MTDICNYVDDTTRFSYNGLKLNGSKCHLFICGHKFKSMICKIEDALVIETFKN